MLHHLHSVKKINISYEQYATFKQTPLIFLNYLPLYERTYFQLQIYIKKCHFLFEFLQARFQFLFKYFIHVMLILKYSSTFLMIFILLKSVQDTFNAFIYWLHHFPYYWHKVRSAMSRGGGAVARNVRPASGTLGVRIPAATDLSLQNQYVLVSRVLEDNHYKHMPRVSECVAH